MSKKPTCFVRIKIMVLLILIFPVAIPSVSYAGFFREQPSSGSSGTGNENYNNNAGTAEKYGGFFRSSSDSDPLDSRPNIGEGIGENTPLGSGLGVLLVCCLAFGVVKAAGRVNFINVTKNLKKQFMIQYKKLNSIMETVTIKKNGVKSGLSATFMLLSFTVFAQDIAWKKNDDRSDVAGKGSADAIIVKYDNSGNVVWKKNFGGSGKDIYDYVTAVSDGIVAEGYSDNSSFGTGDWKGVESKANIDAIAVKYDRTGNILWKKNFATDANTQYSAVTAVLNGIVAAGKTDNPGFDDAFIVKNDNNGNLVWSKTFGGDESLVQDFFYSLTRVSDGIVAVGFSNDKSFGTGDRTGVASKGGIDAIIVKYDNAGNIAWKKNFGGDGDDYFCGITAESDGVVVVGYSNYFSNSPVTK